MKVFVTGATGFVGGYLRKYLKSHEHRIWGTSYPEAPQSFSDEKIFYLDIRSEEDVFNHIQEIQPDWVFHLAAVSNVHHAWNMRRKTLETNIIGTLNILEGIRQFSPEARIVFISSSDLYGSASLSGNPLTERDLVLTMNPYAYSKWGAEGLCDFYMRVENMDVVVARSFPHTGPGQSADFVCSDWASQIVRIEKGLSEPEIKVGNISVERDFTDVRDVVRAYVCLARLGRRGEVYNICSGRSYSLEKILELLLSFTHKKISIRIDTHKLRKVEIPRLVGDNSKVKEEASWEPEIPLEQSLRELLEYWRQKI